MPSDEHGDYKEDAGSAKPMADRCAAPLRYSLERYDEWRYCTQFPRSYYVDEDHPKYSHRCRHHQIHDEQVREDVNMKNAKRLYKHGAFIESHRVLFEVMDLTDLMYAVGIYRGLLEQSRYDFDATEEEVVVDVNDEEIDEEEALLEVPIPSRDTYMNRAESLLLASLDYCRMKTLNVELFKTETFEGMTTVATGTNEGGHIVDSIQEKREHHLNLPLSRLTKDYKKHLEVGGIDLDNEDDAVTVDNRSYTLDYGPDENDGEFFGDVDTEEPERDEELLLADIADESSESSARRGEAADIQDDE
jgi:hypothetical protein